MEERSWLRARRDKVQPLHLHFPGTQLKYINMASSAKRKVLICDDDQGILEVTKIILESNGYDVDTLDNGKAIVKHVKNSKPHLILLDLWMPGIEGKEITKLLKSDQQTKQIPLIIVSAVND